MKRKEKLQVIEDLAKKFSTFGCFYIVDAMGLTVAQVNRFRKNCSEHGVFYQVAKNTLIKKALEESGRKEVSVNFCAKVLKGFSGILFTDQAAKIPAKLVKEFLKLENLDFPVLKGASIYEELFVGAAHLEMLSQLKSKEEVLGDIVQYLQSPMMNLMASIQSVEGQLMGFVNKLSSAR